VTLACGASAPAAPTPTPIVVAPTPISARQGVYTVTTGADRVAAGDQLAVSWTASTGGNLDWIGMFRTGEPDTAYGWWEYTYAATSGTLTLTAPSQAGQYEFRYLLDDAYIDAARSTLVTVY
jgi:hypothetical protein